MQPTNTVWYTVLMVLTTPFFAAGCGGHADDTPDLGEVSGTVTLDGKPLSGALVTFQPGSGRPSTAETDENGQYTLSYSSAHLGAKVGKHSVRITKSDVSETTKDGEPIEKEIVPSKYNANSELSEEVKPGSQTIDFELESG